MKETVSISSIVAFLIGVLLIIVSAALLKDTWDMCDSIKYFGDTLEMAKDNLRQIKRVNIYSYVGMVGAIFASTGAICFTIANKGSGEK